MVIQCGADLIMLCSNIQGNSIKSKTPRNTPSVTTIIAVAAFILSLWNFYDAQFRSIVDVIAGRQIRLYVVANPYGRRNPQPCIMMSLTYTNHGGKTGTVFDTKIGVKWLRNDRIVLEREFKALREIPDFSFLTEKGEFTQYPISAIAIHGKSNEVRRYVFVPYDTISQEDIPKSFDLEINVYTQTLKKWLLKGRYRADNITGVWQDLKSDSTFKSEVPDIQQIK
jgi:hypothetical protein